VQWQGISNEKNSSDEQVQENGLGQNVAQRCGVSTLSDTVYQLNRLPNQEAENETNSNFWAIAFAETNVSLDWLEIVEMKRIQRQTLRAACYD